MKIIFKNEDNSIGIITPSNEAIMICSGNVHYNSDGVAYYPELTEEELQEALNIALPIIAEKDVPKDLPYKIVSNDDIPSDRTFRNAWEWDNTIEPDGFGGESNEFDAELLKAYHGELNDSNK